MVERSDLDTLRTKYATWRESTPGRLTDALERDLILERVGPATSVSILDVGCGDGVPALELAERGAQATGVDNSLRMWPSLASEQRTPGMI